MMKILVSVPHYLTGAEIAALLQVDPDIIDRMIRCGRHPLWKWLDHWSEPRWSPNTIPEWLSMFNTTDLNSLPENPPALERPVDVFRKSRRIKPSREELRIAAKICGIGK